MLLGFTGDISLNNNVPADAFRDLASQLPPGLRLFLNFESTFHAPGHTLVPARNKVLVTSPVDRIKHLSQIPTEIVCLGNNHIGDYGNDIAEFTISQLTSRFHTFGAGRLREPFHRLIYEADGVRIGFLSYCTTETSPLHSTETRIGPRGLVMSVVYGDIQAMRGLADHIVAILHWGEEDIHYPSVQQYDLARALVDTGVDLIIGTHSHAVQGMLCYQGCHVCFGLGNCYFPDIDTSVNGCRIRHRFFQKGKWGIIPYFRFARTGIQYEGTVYVEHTDRGFCRASEDPWYPNKLCSLSRSLTSASFRAPRRSRRLLTLLANRLEEIWLKEDKLATIWRKLKRLGKLLARGRLRLESRR